MMDSLVRTLKELQILDRQIRNERLVSAYPTL